ncbi:hypothetical protein UlMin_043789 [Ulmus minor]
MPLGRITLRVVFGAAPCQASVSVNFLVVDSPSVYNTIIGRETLHALRTVASTYHMLLKFPTPNGIGVVDGAQMVSRETYELATTAQFRRTEPTSTKRRNPGECLQVGTVDHVDYGVITGAIQLGSLDPRDDFYEQRGSPVEDLEEIQFTTYQRLVNEMFAKLLGRSMEVYVDDMLVKSLQAEQHIQHLDETFQTLGRYKMKLNPAKCAFGVASGKFLGFMVHQRGIEANPEKIQALLDMTSPVKIRDVQSLTGRIAALNRFIARATDRSLPFFKALRRGVDFVWTDECERSFQELKEYLGKAPILSKPIQGETLILYLAVSEAAVSSANLAKPRMLGEVGQMGNRVKRIRYRLVSAQVNTEFQAREPRMAAYLQLAQSVISCFDSFEITHIPRAENSEADRLARIGSGIDKNSRHHVDILCSPSTDGISINQVDEEPTWMTPIVGYLLRGELPQDRTEV